MGVLNGLIFLDLNLLFSYIQPTDNPYYVEACNHHEFYITLMQRFARYHALEKLDKELKERAEKESSLMTISE